MALNPEIHKSHFLFNAEGFPAVGTSSFDKANTYT